MWFSSWDAVVRVLAAGVASYVLLVLLLRISGKRTLSKLNAFDLVVTVAMGSTLSSVLLSRDVPVSDGVAGFLVLVAAQWAVARLSVHLPSFGRAVRSEPRLLLADGRMREDALVAERVTREEVLAALRQAGIRRVEDAAAVVLESDGSMSVLGGGGGAELTVLEGVRR